MSIIETRLNVCFLFLPLFLCLFSLSSFVDYRKTTKISPGGYIFQRPFLRGLFLEGLIFRGAYVRREICALFYLVFEGKVQVQAPRGLILVAI